MAATITTSVVTGGSNSHATTSYEANAFATDFVGQGVVGTIANTLGVAPATGSFAVNAQGTPAMFVDVTLGSAWITATPSGQASQALRAYMSANYTSYAISSNASGSTKYDWIYLKVSATAAANPDSAADDVTALFTSRSSSNTADNGSPPTYGIPLAIVTVANGASSITNANIKDTRSQATPSSQVSSTGTGWTSSTAPTSVSALGNRSYSVVTNSTDLTGTISAGMRLKMTRTVTAPTQCTSLNGSTQYYSKSSPAAMTFTDDFVVSAWVKLSSYQLGSIASRVDAASAANGWDFQMTASGQLALIGRNGGTSNVSYVQSYQSVPLNKWVHVAAQLDMSTFTATPTTSYVMIDGVDVPASVTRGGSNPTALVQSGTLIIGAASSTGTNQFFPGKLAQVAIYNAKVTQANVLATISQTLSGSETSLISAYSFNNTINDLNANANNLTAQGSAVATNADSPFTGGDSVGITEYGIVTAAAFSTNTTLTVQTPIGYAIPTTGGVSAVSYSTASTPYGFPKQRGLWRITCYYNSSATKSSASSSTTYAMGEAITIPIGQWVVDYRASGYMLITPTGQADIRVDLNSATVTPPYPSSTGATVTPTSPFASEGYANSILEGVFALFAQDSLSLSSQTPYWLTAKPVSNQTITTAGFLHSQTGGRIVAELTYL